MFKDGIKLTGKVSIKKYNKDKELVQQVDVPNLVVTSGKEFIASRIIEDTAETMGYMAIGDDESTVVAGQSSLINEVQRVAVTTATRAGANITFTATFGTGVAADIKEAGVFNVSSSGGIGGFDADAIVQNTPHTFLYPSHPFADGDKVVYTDGGGVTITGLVDGGVYYVRDSSPSSFALAASLGGTAIAVEAAAGSGSNHKITKGAMLCRTTFPLISKSLSETLAIAWVVTVG